MNDGTTRAMVGRIENDLAMVLLSKFCYAVTWPIEHLPEGILREACLKKLIR